MALYGSALIPDFQQFYGIRLLDVLFDWHSVEVMALIDGLPPESRYAARIAGFEGDRGWSSVDWLVFDIRNSLELLRAAKQAKPKQKLDFHEWPDYPGKAAAKRRKAKAVVAKLTNLAAAQGMM